MNYDYCINNIASPPPPHQIKNPSYAPASLSSK